MNKLLPFLTFISFALWWGGFTFYASWVVPIAHEVLGNHVLAGMITQRVSHVLKPPPQYLTVKSSKVHSKK